MNIKVGTRVQDRFGTSGTIVSVTGNAPYLHLVEFDDGTNTRLASNDLRVKVWVGRTQDSKTWGWRYPTTPQGWHDLFIRLDQEYDTDVRSPLHHGNRCPLHKQGGT